MSAYTGRVFPNQLPPPPAVQVVVYGEQVEERQESGHRVREEDVGVGPVQAPKRVTGRREVCV